MRPFARRLLAALFCLTVIAPAASACTRAMPSRAESTPVPAKGIDQGLLDAAVRAEVNFARCQKGLPTLAAASRGLTKAAEGHSRWMVRAQRLSHHSNVPGQSSVVERVMSAASGKVRAGSENIGVLNRYRIDGQSFRILNSGQCQFASASGSVLGPHSYASLARQIVGMWMSSPGHRRNILDPKVNRVSTAAAFDPGAPYCGKFWLTQNFVG